MWRLFWDLWRSTYLQSLAARQKWRTRQRNLEIGDLVIELDKGLAPGKWKTGRVAATYPGTDGLVRAVDVEIEGKLFRRGLPKLCLLAPVFFARCFFRIRRLGGGCFGESHCCL